MFLIGLAYREFLHQLLNSCENLLDFHVKKADRSQAPRRPDFNRLYSTYCKEKYGDKNGEAMFDALQQLVTEFKESSKDASAMFQPYTENDCGDIQPFILAIVTPLMKRVHQMVCIIYYFSYCVQKNFSKYFFE